MRVGMLILPLFFLLSILVSSCLPPERQQEHEINIVAVSSGEYTLRIYTDTLDKFIDFEVNNRFEYMLGGIKGSHCYSIVVRKHTNIDIPVRISFYKNGKYKGTEDNFFVICINLLSN